MSNLGNRTHHTGAFRPGAGRPMGFEAHMQALASAAHLRGVVITKGETIVATIEARELLRQIRTLHTAAGESEARRWHVESLAAGLVVRLTQCGPVLVSAYCWQLLGGSWAARRKRARA